MKKKNVIIISVSICVIICLSILIAKMVSKKDRQNHDVTEGIIHEYSPDSGCIRVIFNSLPFLITHEYGTSPGNREYSACQGDNALYICDYTDGRKIYTVSSVNKVRLIGMGSQNSVHYNGYMYFKRGAHQDTCIDRINEKTGEVETIIDPHDVLADKTECTNLDIFIAQLVDGEMYFYIRYYWYGYYTGSSYIYNCDDGTIRENGADYFVYDDNYCSQMTRELVVESEKKKFLPWEFNSNLNGNLRQYYKEYIYTFAALPGETVYSRGVCRYAPRDLCVVNYIDAFSSEDSSKEDCKNVIDTNVTVFNVGFENIYYVKKEEGRNVCSIWKAELDGSNPQKITEIETEEELWGMYLAVGDNVMVCMLSNWEENNRKKSVADYEYEKYVISIDGSTVNRLEDVIVE